MPLFSDSSTVGLLSGGKQQVTVFVSSGPVYLSAAKNKVFHHVDYQTQVSQLLIDAAHKNDTNSAIACLDDPFCDVNFIGTVSLRSRKTEVVLNGESAHEVRFDYQEFRTDVTALFLAAHAGNSPLVRKLLSLGANPNQKLFRGYATTAAVREGHLEIVEMLIKAGASQEACEEALMEASYFGQARLAEILMSSDLIRPRVAVHALVSASCRGFVNVVDALCGVDANAMDRILLQSSKPMLHTNVYSNALAAAIVSRQISVVRLLLQAGVTVDTKVRIGAWSWDMETGEEIRVGSGLAEAYSVTWCAVEYFESTGAILRMLLAQCHLFPNVSHLGRTLIHHAILCHNAEALKILVNLGADVEYPAVTSKTQLRPIHLAARLGSARVLEQLITAAANVDSLTNSGETALMISAKYKQEECLKILASSGADFGLLDSDGNSVESVAKRENWGLGFQQAAMEVIRSGKSLKSSSFAVFSPLAFSIRAMDLHALKKLTEKADVDLDEQDGDGFTPLMVAAAGGHIDAFRLLLQAGADVKLRNKRGETAMNLAESNPRRIELFEKALNQCGFYQMNCSIVGNNALHRAAVRGDLGLVQTLISQGCDVNALDGDLYTPLMLAARGGHGKICSLLISSGARVDFKNEREETALVLARKSGGGGEAAEVILDYKAREVVLEGGRLKKHSRGGKGKPEYKALEMVSAEGVLRWQKWWWWWGKTSVVCKEAKVGPATKFRWNRRRMTADLEEAGLFHVVTTKGKVVHFVCEDGGDEMAELWVRGIKIITREAICGK
ncbi:Ank3 [Linum grandiflorum]